MTRLKLSFEVPVMQSCRAAQEFLGVRVVCTFADIATYKPIEKFSD